MISIVVTSIDSGSVHVLAGFLILSLLIIKQKQFRPSLNIKGCETHKIDIITTTRVHWAYSQQYNSTPCEHVESETVETFAQVLKHGESEQPTDSILNTSPNPESTEL